MDKSRAGFNRVDAVYRRCVSVLPTIEDLGSESGITFPFPLPIDSDSNR